VTKHRPALEDPFHRDATLGYDPPADINCLVRCVSHGTPSPLIRWHYHEDYEIHLVVATHGKMFVGDYIGTFEPGNLVLVGAGLPHNWISTDAPPEGVPLRDHCVVFDRAPVDQSAKAIPELATVGTLLDRAANGIEFFGVSDQALKYFERMKECRGIARLAVFFEFLGMLSRCDDHRLLSNDWAPEGRADDGAVAMIDEVVNFISERYSEPLTLTDVAKRFFMSESHFSRVFRRGTGNSFTEFLIRVRITRACQLLMQSDENISSICYEVGFNNVANFNRRFLDVKGTTPSNFRRESLVLRHVGGRGHPSSPTL
jgi:AraC-like DNA-binding protein